MSNSNNKEEGDTSSSDAELAFCAAKFDRRRQHQTTVVTTGQTTPTTSNDHNKKAIHLLQAFFAIPRPPETAVMIIPEIINDDDVQQRQAPPLLVSPSSFVPVERAPAPEPAPEEEQEQESALVVPPLLVQPVPQPPPPPPPPPPVPLLRPVSVRASAGRPPVLTKQQSFGGSETNNNNEDEEPPSSSSNNSNDNKMSSNWNNVPVRRRRTKKLSPRTIARRLTRKYKNQKSPSQWYHSVAAKNRLGSVCEDILLSDTEEGGSSDAEGSERDFCKRIPPQQPPPNSPTSSSSSSLSPLQQAKRDLLQALNETLGDASTPAFKIALHKLTQQYDPATRIILDPRSNMRRCASRANREDGFQELEGIGISAGKPSFPGCIGRNAKGDPLYKLGRMSFDMFCPTQLVVSVQGTFVLIDCVDGTKPDAVKHVPKNLLADVRFGKSTVRTYDIVTPFTIEPWKPEFGGGDDDSHPNKGITEDQPPIRGIMTTYGFILPYPLQTHRFSVWFTGGAIEQVGDNNDSDNGGNVHVKNEKWFQIFGNKSHSRSSSNSSSKSTTRNSDNHPTTLPTTTTTTTRYSNNNNNKRTMVESGKLLAAKLLMGASTDNDQLDENGKLSYTLTRPLSNYIDLIYLDKKLQVLRGSSGTVYVHVRIPGQKAVRNQRNSAAAAAAAHQQSSSSSSSTNDAKKIASILNNNSNKDDAFFLLSDDDGISSQHEGEEEDGNNNNNNSRDVSSSLPHRTIDEETQRRVKALIKGGRLKEAAELLGKAHSGELKKQWHHPHTSPHHHHSRAASFSVDAPQHYNHSNSRVRRTASEDNLMNASVVTPVTNRCYAREA